METLPAPAGWTDPATRVRLASAFAAVCASGWVVLVYSQAKMGTMMCQLEGTPAAQPPTGFGVVWTLLHSE